MEHNILAGNWLESDKELFFGPLNGSETFKEVNQNLLMANLLHTLGLFDSASQARKAGWNKPIPKGWSEFTVGKLKTKIYILNIQD